jgi:flagellar basal body-associated protein FliL
MATKKEVPEEVEAAVEATASPKKKKLIIFGGSSAGVIAAAFIAATLAAPSKREYKVFEGPWVASISPDNIQTNLKGENHKRFLVFAAEAYFEAYDEQYAAARVQDPAYLSLVKDVILQVSSRRTVDEVNSEVGKAAFREDLRQSIDPFLFPVQIGKTSTPADRESASGLKMGISAIRSNFRTPLYDGKLYLDVRGDRAPRTWPADPLRRHREGPARRGRARPLRVPGRLSPHGGFRGRGDDRSPRKDPRDPPDALDHSVIRPRRPNNPFK